MRRAELRRAGRRLAAGLLLLAVTFLFTLGAVITTAVAPPTDVLEAPATTTTGTIAGEVAP